MKRISKRSLTIGIFIILAIAALMVIRIRRQRQQAVSYQTAQAAKGTLTVSVSGTGNVVVDKQATINPGITGKVTELAVKVGDQVKKGQLLFKISNDQLDVTVSKSYISYLQAKQSLENNKSQLIDAQNNQTTVNNKSTSTDDDKNLANQKVVAAQAAVDVATANVDTAFADYNLQKTTADQRIVTAPIAGTITSVNVTNGDQLGSGGSNQSSSASTTSSSPITIDDLNTLKASVSINEVDASQVQGGQKVSMTFDAIDGLTLTGKVERVSTVGTETQGVVSYPATITFDVIDKRVKPQMSLSAVITTDVKQNVLTVPNAAVKSQNNTHYVQLLENGTPRQQDVVIGAANDTSTEITNGLSEGDTVVTQTITSQTQSTSATQSRGFGIPGLGGGGGFRAPTGGGAAARRAD